MPSVELVAGNPIVVPAREGTTTTHSPGDLVKFDSSGYILIGTTGVICAIARKTGAGSANVECEIELLNKDNVYRMTSSDTLTQAMVGKLATITFTEGAHTLAAATGGADAYVVALEDPVGTVGGRVLVQFLDSAIVAGLAA